LACRCFPSFSDGGGCSEQFIHLSPWRFYEYGKFEKQSHGIPTERQHAAGCDQRKQSCRSADEIGGGGLHQVVDLGGRIAGNLELGEAGPAREAEDLAIETGGAHMIPRKILPARRESITQKIRVGHRRTLYLSTDAAHPPLELFLRVRGTDCTAETVALYDCLARLVSIALQYGVPLETIGKLLRGVKVEPGGIVTGHPTMHFCSSLPDAIGQHLLSVLQDSPIAKE
jgi:hypothetical protein